MSSPSLTASSVKEPNGDRIASPSSSTTIALTAAVWVLLVSISENVTVPIASRLVSPSSASPSASSVTDTASDVPIASITGSSFVPVIVNVTVAVLASP